MERIETPYGECRRFYHRFHELQVCVADPHSILFFDLESTGFSPDEDPIFLLGLGRPEEDGLLVEQVLAPDWDAEPAGLWWFTQQLKPGSRLITYNGSSFDLPRLRARLDLHRIEYDLHQVSHLDLYHTARRLLNPEQGFRLRNLEQEFLSRFRPDDLPSRKAPSAYYEWLYSGCEEPLLRVLRHNREDIRSMAHLFSYFLTELDPKLP